MSVDLTECFGEAPRWEDLGLPCPLIEGFTYRVDAGLVRTNMESGLARQRRRYRDRPTTYVLIWHANTEQLRILEELALEKGFDWIYVPMVTGQVPEWMAVDHLIRFVSMPQITLIEKDRWTFSVVAAQYLIDAECVFDAVCDDILACVQDAQLRSFTIPQFLPTAQILPVSFWTWVDPND